MKGMIKKECTKETMVHIDYVISRYRSQIHQPYDITSPEIARYRAFLAGTDRTVGKHAVRSSMIM